MSKAMKKFEKLMSKSGAKKLSEDEIKAKLKVLNDITQLATQGLGSSLAEGMKKRLTVAANDTEGLKKGLDKAKEYVDEHEEEIEDSEDE